MNRPGYDCHQKFSSALYDTVVILISFSLFKKGGNCMVRSFFTKEEGQGLVEYALILVLIAIVVIGILSLLGGKVSTVFSTINSGLS